MKRDTVVIAALLLFLFWKRKETVTATVGLEPVQNGIPGQWIPQADGTFIWFPDQSTTRVPTDPGMSWPPASFSLGDLNAAIQDGRATGPAVYGGITGVPPVMGLREQPSVTAIFGARPSATASLPPLTPMTADLYSAALFGRPS